MIVAFDLSLTATGWAQWHHSGRIESGVLNPPKSAASGIPRLRWIRGTVNMLAHNAELVVLEGYAFGAKGNAVYQIAELGGVVRVALAERQLRVVEVPATSLKKFATGKGNAGKPDMLAAAIKQLDFGGTDDNEVDALWLLEMARLRYRLIDDDHELVEQTQYRTDVLAKIAFPNVFIPHNDPVLETTP